MVYSRYIVELGTPMVIDRPNSLSNSTGMRMLTWGSEDRGEKGEAMGSKAGYSMRGCLYFVYSSFE